MKAHVSLNVRNVAESVDFYRRFFGVEPVKLKADYAKFDLEHPALNFTMNERPSLPPGSLSHLGIQVESTEAVLAAKERLQAAGLVSMDEMDTTCCYALQDKIWVTDPDGHQWEVFHVLVGDTDVAEDAAAACCKPDRETEESSECRPGGPCCDPAGACC